MRRRRVETRCRLRADAAVVDHRGEFGHVLAGFLADQPGEALSYERRGQCRVQLPLHTVGPAASRFGADHDQCSACGEQAPQPTNRQVARDIEDRVETPDGEISGEVGVRSIGPPV